MQDSIRMQPDETIKDYKIRLFRNKTVYNLKPQAIADLINNVAGTNYNESTFRKWWAIYSEALEDCKNADTSPIQGSNNENNEIKFKGSVEYKNGNVTSDKLIEICDNEEMTPEILMQKHGLDSSKWSVVSYKNNYWHSQVKGGKQMVMYQSKITVKPLIEELSIATIDNYFNQPHDDWKEVHNRKYENNYNDSDEFLEICIPDLHVGLLSYADEVGQDFNYKIVQERYYKCLYDIIERSEGKKFSKIYFVPLGDFLHFDNAQGASTRNTLQTCESRYNKMFDVAEDMLINGINMLSELGIVEIPYISGNHDECLGYALFRSAKNAFRNNNRVTFDCSHRSRKFRQEGSCLIGWCHGNISKGNLSEWLQIEARKEHGLTKHSEVHAGHLHSSLVTDKSGIVIRHLPTITGESDWEYNKGYHSANKAITSFVWNREVGLREIWLSQI